MSVECRWYGKQLSIVAIAIVAIACIPTPVCSQTGSPINSVDELSDVEPGDWAYEAVRSLIERYDLDIADAEGRFRGNRPLTRYEFAYILAQVVAQLDVSGTEELVARADLETVARLLASYRDATASLRDRLDNRIEPAINTLERQDFSNTTQLDGQFVLAITDGAEANPTIVDRLRLTLTTGFDPGILVTRLEVGNNGGDAASLAHNRDANLLGTTGLLAGGGGLDFTEVSDTLHLDRLYFRFQPFEDLEVAIGPKIAPRDFVDRNSLANNTTIDFSSSFFANNPLIIQNAVDRPGGAGLGLTWDIPNLPLVLNAAYAAADGGDSSDGGLFADRASGTIELEFNSDDLPGIFDDRPLRVRLQYTHADIDDTDIDAIGINAEWQYAERFGLFGRFGLGSYNGFNTALGEELDLSPRTWAVGISVRNWPIPGNFAGIALGQPFIARDLGDATQTNFEAFYNLQLSDRLSVTPIFSAIDNADNDGDNDLLWQTTLRTVFSF